MNNSTIGGILRLVTNGHKTEELEKKFVLPRGRISANYKTVNCIQNGDHEYTYKCEIHRDADVIDYFWLMITIPGFNEYEFKSIFDIVDEITIRRGDEYIDRLDGKLIETYLLMEDPLAYDIFSQSHNDQLRIPIPFFGKIKNGKSSIIQLLNNYLFFNITVQLTNPSTWILKNKKILTECHQDSSNLISRLPTFVLNNYILKPYLDKVFTGSVDICYRYVLLDTPKRREYSIYEGNNYFQFINHSNYICEMIDGEVLKKNIYTFANDVKRIIVRIDADTFDFNDLISINVYKDNLKIIEITPEITKKTIAKRGLKFINMPIYTIDFDDTDFRFHSKHVISIDLTSKCKLNGKVHIWFINK